MKKYFMYAIIILLNFNDVKRLDFLENIDFNGYFLLKF